MAPISNIAAAGVAVAAGAVLMYKLSGSGKSSLPVPPAEDDKKNFMACYKKLVPAILYDKADHPPAVMDWMVEMIDYNVPGGKLNRGISVVQGVRTLKPELLADPDQMYRICALGWCIEWLQASFLVADDIMDHSPTRRGQPCWYCVPKVGMAAVNDVLLLDKLIYRILKMYWSNEKYYLELIELFHQVSYCTIAGQLSDVLVAPVGEVDLSLYTMDRYNHIVKYKTAYYSFYLSVACAFHVCQVTDPKAYKVAEEICMIMGEFFQVQDDYLDCYGAPEVIGKIGTDIEDNKCSWLVCQALLIATPEQTATLKKYYGKSDKPSVQKIKDLYKELKMEERYKKYEQDSYEKICAIIDKKSPEANKPLFMWMLGRIYKRQK
eukprot:CAMPEP_0197866330 /NCGR_PEP_ID=MMETSP1438-20131217/44158_1 /TAXON_ID=1461541 /ORGANISM="Pterosperma sp., Strain CCMP1384" /LENGTH=378 /DNA_ID=CAMNT_0043484889 /DNA_START=486 /DNA_END=1622 /DNA_ORIENTATION=-